MTMKKLLAAATVAAAVALTGGTAFATAPSTETRSIEIRVGNVDFSNPAEVDSLQRDMIRAATRVCGRPDQRMSARQVAQRSACARAAVDQAVQTANIAPLSVLHANLAPQDKYRSWRAQPSDQVLRLVAEAAVGRTGAAGTVAR